MGWLLGIKFRRSVSYGMDELLLELIELTTQLETKIKEIEDRLDAGGL